MQTKRTEGTEPALQDAARRSQSAPSDRRAEDRRDLSQSAHHDAIFTLARASEFHDEDTGSHVIRIRALVEQIALQMGVGADEARELGYDAMLHDVGKLQVPPEVLQKPGLLDDRERRVMQSHTTCGERLLSDRPSMQRAARIARSHHESWDGSGYPDGLAGEAIPLEARITAVADVLDALMSFRAYKKSWTLEKTMEEVIRLSGSRLDPRVVEAACQCNANGALNEIFTAPQQFIDHG